jgi:hypothetical protein
MVNTGYKTEFEMFEMMVEETHHLPSRIRPPILLSVPLVVLAASLITLQSLSWSSLRVLLSPSFSLKRRTLLCASLMSFQSLSWSFLRVVLSPSSLF